MIERFREVERTAAEQRPRLSAKPCGCWPAPMSPPKMPPPRPTPTGRRWSPAPGWRRRLKGLRSPQGLARIDPGDGAERHAAAVPAGGRALALSARETRPRGLPGRRHGTRQDHSGAFAAAGSQAPERRPAAAEPAGGAGIAAGQLGVGDRTLCAGLEGAHRPSVGAAGGRTEGSRRRSGCGTSTW